MPASPKKPKIRISLPKGSRIEDVPWKAIIDAFYEQLRISKEKKEAVMRPKSGERLEKKLEMARMLMAERVNSSGDGTVILDSSFLVELVNLLRLCEQLVVIDALETELWIQFLSIMIDKMKKEKLVVYKNRPEPAKKQSQEQKPKDETGKAPAIKRLSNVYTKL